MEEREKNQKTVVAFIAGLLIGGLLVWVFSIAPGNDEMPDEKKETSSTKMQDDSSTSESTEDDDARDAIEAVISTEAPQRGERAEPKSVTGDGSISVNDQPASARVSIASLVTPINEGWVVIHDVYADGSLGNALGAARFSKEDGLTPTIVELLRAMTAGGKYRAVLYAESGDRVFNLGIDAVLMKGSSRIEDSFTAS